MKQAWRRPTAWALIGAVVVTLVLAGAGAFTARAADPIRIGLGMALTGGLSANGKPALLAMQIWKDEINKKGGLLGRPVELVFYDDQTNPATVPGIYTKLLDVDKVDLVVSGYGTNLIAPLHPNRERGHSAFPTERGCWRASGAWFAQWLRRRDGRRAARRGERDWRSRSRCCPAPPR